jgi:antitoxin HigA-1
LIGRTPAAAPGKFFGAPALCDLVDGKALSPEMALRIEKAWVSMDTLLRMQAWHDSHAMRQRAGEIDVERYEPV